MEQITFMGKINTGGGCLVDYYIEKINSEWKVVTVNDEYAAFYAIDANKYKEFIEEKAKELQDYYETEVITVYDDELLFWLLLENYSGIENTITNNLAIDIDINLNYFNKNIKDRMKICENLIKINKK